MNQKQAQRLADVALALREAAAWKAHFSMQIFGWDKSTSWYRQDGSSAGNLGDNPDGFVQLIEKECGTPACALGHYAVRSDLQDTFKLTVDGNLRYKKEADYNRNEFVCFDDDALQKYFGIDEEEIDELFDSDGCDNAKEPLEAAEYIEKFLERKGYTYV